MHQKVAVITGATGGIGKAIAKCFLKRNYKLLLVGRSLSRLSDLNSEFPESDIEYLELDICDHEEIMQGIKSFIDNHSRIDVLVNSAGYVKRGTTELSHEEFTKMLDVNLVGLFDMTNAVVPIMKQQGSGRIINISSYSGVVARDCLGGYAASKFGLMGLNEALHKELAPHGIYVTVICPNLVDTGMTKDVTSINRDEFIKVDDIVESVEYLLKLTPNVMIKELILRCRAKLLKTVDG